ncbi:helix-turn-helix domain-containing protein [Nocardia sp. NPDC050378]|uniref:helix-turn-helix domain-containing protein n=1 Tax=Nocardia sp. NPDC050378 TaxID=3155400 RepID=UPI00340125A0
MVGAMRKRRAVTIAPVEQRLTTQQAADLLGISRPTLIKLLEAGKLPCDKPSGRRHRRLLLSDVLEYQQGRAERSGVLDQLVSDAEDDGLYHPPPEDYQALGR